MKNTYRQIPSSRIPSLIKNIEPKKPTHNFCWVATNSNIFKEEGKVIFVDTSNLKAFERAGFNVSIPYYLSKNIDSSTRNSMIKNIKNNYTTKAIDFNTILEADIKKNSGLQRLALMVGDFIGRIEQNQSQESDKICAILDVMKLYMSAKNNNMALDFNIELKDKSIYLQKLQNSEMYFSIHPLCKRKDYEVEKPSPENKLIYISNNCKEKISFAESIMKELNEVITKNTNLSRDSVFMPFVKHAMKFSSKFKLTEDEIDFPEHSQSYQKANNKVAHGRTH